MCSWWDLALSCPAHSTMPLGLTAFREMGFNMWKCVSNDIKLAFCIFISSCLPPWQCKHPSDGGDVKQKFLYWCRDLINHHGNKGCLYIIISCGIPHGQWWWSQTKNSSIGIKIYNYLTMATKGGRMMFRNLPEYPRVFGNLLTVVSVTIINVHWWSSSGLDTAS